MKSKEAKKFIKSMEEKYGVCLDYYVQKIKDGDEYELVSYGSDDNWSLENLDDAEVIICDELLSLETNLSLEEIAEVDSFVLGMDFYLIKLNKNNLDEIVFYGDIKEVDFFLKENHDIVDWIVLRQLEKNKNYCISKDKVKTILEKTTTTETTIKNTKNNREILKKIKSIGSEIDKKIFYSFKKGFLATLVLDNFIDGRKTKPVIKIMDLKEESISSVAMFYLESDFTTIEDKILGNECDFSDQKDMEKLFYYIKRKLFLIDVMDKVVFEDWYVER